MSHRDLTAAPAAARPQGHPKMPSVVKILLAMLLLTTAAIGGLGWLSAGTYRGLGERWTGSLRLARLSGTIAQLDEGLTMSARMAAATGEPRWEQRYRRFETQLDAAIQEALKLCPDEHLRQGVAQTSAANAELVAMENRVFELVRQGDRQAAAELLFSNQYENRKRVYSDRLTEIMAAAGRQVKESQRLQERRLSWVVMWVVGLLTLLPFCWAVAVGMVCRHIAERRQVELAFRESRQMLQLVLDTIPARVFWKDRDLSYLGCNCLFARDAGLDSPEQIVGKDDRQMPWKDQAELYRRDDRTVIDNQQPRLNFEEPQDAADRRGKWVHTSKIPLRSADGQIVGVLGTYEDITDRKQADKQRERLIALLTESNRVLEDLNARLERSNQELQDFAYVASHDLQEPLRKVQAFGDRLRAESGELLSDKGRDHLVRMQNAAGRMQALIDGLLDFSRVTTQARPFAAVDLGQVAREVLSDLETRIEEAEARLDLGRLPTVDADPLQMRQLLQNLIGNALKFHRPGVPPVVRIHARWPLTARRAVKGLDRSQPNLEPSAANRDSSHDSGFCQITVEDNGIGFDDRHAERIFGVFQRLHGRGTYEGTGVGLAICRKIVERHGGEITAHGRPDTGASFIITLPIRQAREDDTPEAS